MTKTKRFGKAEKVRRRTGHLNRTAGNRAFVYGVVIFFALFMVLPVIYTISSAFKPLEELWIFPPRFLVSNPTTKNFSDLVKIVNNSYVPLGRYILNTVIIAVTGTAGHVLIASMCAYAFSKHRFIGRDFFFNLVVLTLMFNAAVTQIPNFIIISRLGWIDTYLPYIIPAFAMPIGLYLMKQFIDQMIPDSLLEAAKIDGAGEMTIIVRIVMPNVKPAWVTLVILCFQTLWGTGGNVYIYDEALKTFNYALSQILAGGIARAGVGAAAAVIMLVVPSLMFLLSQSQVLETMSTSGMKE